MCEVKNCIHHEEPNRCLQGYKMTCIRRMEKLGLKIKYHDRKHLKELVWGTLEMSNGK